MDNGHIPDTLAEGVETTSDNDAMAEIQTTVAIQTTTTARMTHDAQDMATTQKARGRTAP